MEFASLIFFFLIIAPSAIIHEYMHGAVANYFGDPTAKYAGRLTLDPRPHIDLWGTLLLPAMMFLFSGGRFLFAYAKPVPINPLLLRGRFAGIWVAAAGPLSNFVVAAIFGMLVRALPFSTFSMILNLIVYANVLLGVFNLIPIPPLDGSKVLFPLLPASLDEFKYNMERYGFIILLLVIFVIGLQWIFPVVVFLHRLFTGGGLPF
ncbi:MAG: Peptidase M50 [Parcubacteria group bacterium GW2011_GWA2_47_26]|nr:MAG: Peptidase M50 [Parcubacteria group bacterium GW2011_GWA2_47_26]